MRKFPLLEQISSLQSENEGSYFNLKYQTLHETEWFQHFLGEYEKVLAQLDSNSWNYILEQTQVLCTTKDKHGRWNALFEKLNEVRGYAYLKSIGCNDVKFLLPSTKNGVETPDLLGVKGGTKVLCEVKTKQSSDVYMSAVNTTKVIRANEFMPTRLKELTERIFNKAYSQLISFPNQAEYRKIIYFNVEYDSEKVDQGFKASLDKATRKIFEFMQLDNVELVIHDEHK